MNPILRIFLLIALGLLSVGTVVKRKDAIRLTQTDPVSYKEKLKEEEAGKKGPPAPTLELFPKERFLAEGPVEKGKPAELQPEEAPDDTLDKSEETWEFDDTSPHLDTTHK